MPTLETNYKSVVNVPTGKLAGRSTAGIGPLEALSIDASLLLSGGKLALNTANANTWTAPQTNSYSGTASQGALTLTGTPFAGTGTTSTPLHYLNNGVTAPTSWSASGTYFGVNAASGFAGNFLDFHVNGGASLAKVDNNGNLSAASLTAAVTSGSRYAIVDSNGVHIKGSSFLGFASSSTDAGGTPDVQLTRKGAANLQLGATDAAAPVAQTLSVQNVVAGTTNTAGANLTISGSQGTGTGVGGSIVFQTAPAGLTGTTQNALVTAFSIDSTQKIVFPLGANLYQNGTHLKTDATLDAAGFNATLGGITAVGANNTLGTITPAPGNPTLTISTNNPTRSLLVLRAFVTQTADAFQYQNSTGTAVMASIDAVGQSHAIAFIPPFAKKTAAYTLTAADNLIAADATTAAFAVTLPASNSLTAGRSYTLKKIDSSANAVTLTAAGTDKIDGAATYALATQYKYVTVTTDGVSNWLIEANN